MWPTFHQQKLLESKRRELENEVLKLEQIQKTKCLNVQMSTLKALATENTDLCMDHNCHIHKLNLVIYLCTN